MGGVVNSILKSGTNEFHGSAFGYWAPYWASANPNSITTVGGSLGYVRKPDFDTSIGVEVGGPIIKDKLFFWAGFAPRFQDTHVFRQTYQLQYDPTRRSGRRAGRERQPDPDRELPNWRARIPESRQTYYYAATLDCHSPPRAPPDARRVRQPRTSTTRCASFNSVEFISNPAWAQEKLTKTNSDFTAHWTSKLFDHRWQIDALAGVHTEYFYDRSPNAALNNRNQLEYWGANLWELEHAPGCEPITARWATSLQPCPVDNYHTGGFGTDQASPAAPAGWPTSSRPTCFEAGGHHELKYGWHPEYVTLRPGALVLGSARQPRADPAVPAGRATSTPTRSSRCSRASSPSDFGTSGRRRSRPPTCSTRPHYQDSLKANV